MRISELVIGIIVVAAVGIGLGGFYTSLMSQYAPEYGAQGGYYSNSTSLGFLNKTGEVVSITSEMSDTVENMANRTGLGGAIQNIADTPSLFVGIGRILLAIPNILGDMVNGGLSSMGVSFPEWFGATIVLIIVVTIVFAVIAIFVRSPI